MEVKVNVYTVVWDTSLGHDLSGQEVFTGDWKKKVFSGLFFMASNHKVKKFSIGAWEVPVSAILESKDYDDMADKVPSIKEVIKRDENHWFEFVCEKATCTIYLKQF